MPTPCADIRRWEMGPWANPGGFFRARGVSVSFRFELPGIPL